TLLAAAVIGCFSWPNPRTEFWLGPGCWYSSLVLSLFSVLLSSSEAFLFRSVCSASQRTDPKKELGMILQKHGGQGEQRQRPSRPGPEASKFASEVNSELPETAGHSTEKTRISDNVRWNMVFTWQAPVMLMPYSFILFILGLTIRVMTPLFDGREFDADSRIAIFYIVFSGIGGGAFMWCSFWAYRFIDLNQE
ncbi:hypothetical protein F5883DRAFT_691326, partial [Diaporthe sp. PMI_573]